MASIRAVRLVASRSRFVAPRPIHPTWSQYIASDSLTRRAGRCSYATETAGQPEPPDYLSESERQIFDKLKDNLSPTKLEVQDISGGCGSMYALDIVSDKFSGLPIVKQHRLVNQVLGDEMKKWHGVQLKTKAP